MSELETIATGLSEEARTWKEPYVVFAVTAPAERLVGLNEIAEPVEVELPVEPEELPEDDEPVFFAIANTRIAEDFEYR